MKKDLLKLYKIIRSSKRVTTVRDMMQLKEGEHIITHSSEEGMLIGNSKNKKRRIVKNIEGEMPIVVLATKVKPYIQKEIIEYFNLSLEYELVEQSILEGRLPTKSFNIWSVLNKKTGKANIKIELDEALSSDNLDYLFKKIKQVNFLVKEFHRTKNTKNLLTLDSSYERIEPIKFLDEKFLLEREYATLRREYPRPLQIPPSALDKLVKKARKLLKIKANYTADSFRKTISDFKKVFAK